MTRPRHGILVRMPLVKVAITVTGNGWIIGVVSMANQDRRCDRWFLQIAIESPGEWPRDADEVILLTAWAKEPQV